MRIAALAASLAVALSATGLAALTSGRGGGVDHYPAVPTRAHIAVGPIQTLVETRDDAEPNISLAAAARARYDRIDALAQVRTEPLPWGDGALLTGIAIRWN